MPSINPIELVEAFERGEYQGLCPNRIWHAWDACKAYSKQEDMQPEILTFLKKFGTTLKDALKHEEHSACSFDFCEFLSRNFTAVQQYHERRPYEEEEQAKVIENHKNKKVCFPLRGMFNDGKLVEAVKSMKRTAWTLDGSAILEHPRPFMAISHIWSDGTGTGTWSSKQVNECLYGYFKGIAEQFQCEGIWWDTLCIPQDRNVRSDALNIMHLNYEFARITLVHDRFLRNLPFQGPKEASFAILLSPWFTRGWTALELAKSRKVKIIFKDSIKDLEVDILHKIDKNSEGYAAKEAIKRLRNGQIKKVEDLLGALRPRYTSWVKDKAAIAGLLVGIAIPDSNRDAFQRDTYRDILKRIKYISHGHLFHKSVTMFGRFSWCPTSLFQLPSVSTEAKLSVNENGEVFGSWTLFSIGKVTDTSIELKKPTSEGGGHQVSCVWENSHELIEAKLKVALKKSWKHLILVVPGLQSRTEGLLVEVWEKEYKEQRKFMCKFLGSLRFEKPLEVDGCTTDITIGDPGPGEGWEQVPLESKIDGIMEKEEQEQMKEKESSPDSRTHGLVIDPRWTALHHAAWLGNTGGVDVAAILNKQESRKQRDEEFIKLSIANGDDANDPDSNGQSPLHRAVWGGSLGIVKLLPKNESCANAKDKAGNTALHVAADTGFEEVATYLCDYVDIQARGRNGLTPLHYAAMSGQYEVVKLLVNHDSIIDAKDHKIGWTPLHCAAENGHTAVIKLLLNKGARFEETDDIIGWTPLHFAAMNAHRAVEELSKHATIDNTIFDCMPEGSKNYEALIEWIKKNSGKFSLETPTRLHLAAIDRRTRMTRSVIASTMTFSENRIEDSNSLMHWAARDGRNGTLSFLVQIGIGIDVADVTGRTPLHFAAENGHGATVQWLLNEGAEIEARDRDGRTPLHCAAANGHEAAVQQLLNECATLVAKDKDGWTPLHWATESGNDAVVRQLLHEGADIEAKDGGGRTPLHWVAENGHEAVVQQLLGKHANIEAKDTNHHTPLDGAALSGSKEVVQVLINALKAEDLFRDAMLPTDGDRGTTPLHAAASSRSKEVVQMLVAELKENDIFPTAMKARDSKRRTPLDGAASSRSKEVVQVLITALKTEELFRTAMEAQDHLIRRVTIQALQGRADLSDETLRGMATLLKDDDPDVRKEAIEALQGRTNLSEEILRDIAARLENNKDLGVRKAAIQVLRSQTKLPIEALQSIVAQLKRENSDIRTVAVEALQGQIDLSEEILRDIAALLKDNDSDVREAAVVAIQGQADLSKEILRDIAAQLEDDDPDVREAAIEALQRRTDLSNEILRDIAARLENNDLGVRKAAIQVLRSQTKLPTEVLQSIVAQLKCENSDIRTVAVEALQDRADLSKEMRQGIAEQLEDEKSDKVARDFIAALEKAGLFQ